MTKKEVEEKEDLIYRVADIQEFIKQSMCIDGKVEFANWQTAIYDGIPLSGLLFKITDKKRGIFYIGWYK